MLSNSALDLVNMTVIRIDTASEKITTIGIGSSSSLTNGAPIVIVLLTKNIMLIAVARLLKGNMRSSSNADWKIATNPT
jgi:hypothetical protein